MHSCVYLNEYDDDDDDDDWWWWRLFADRIGAWEGQRWRDCRGTGWSACACKRVSRRRPPYRCCRPRQSWRWRSRQSSVRRTPRAVERADRGVAAGRPTRRTTPSSSWVSHSRESTSSSFCARLPRPGMQGEPELNELMRSGHTHSTLADGR